ncbi:MAG TPA: glycosyltransferase family 2 protein [Candidatus Paceibacterota bacterium]|nr:glycosyltransferase family 2 protein [Candidatus Paceibacterota bacterium]
MKLSFVIPAYNEENYIGDCLAAIIAQKRALPEYDIEIVVVNNASTDGTAAAVEKYPDVKLVNEPRKGIVFARRAGYLASTGDLIANVDADTRITPGWIGKVMTEFARDPRLVALSGPFIYYDAPRKIRISTRFFYYIGFGFYLINRFVFRIGSMLQGGNFVVRRHALEKIGGYDTTLSFYGEDTDIARRLNKVGHVKFTFKLPALSSGRRLAKEGGLTTGLRYAINYFWITFFKKPFTRDYIDIRLQNSQNTVYAAAHRWKEWVIGSIFVLAIILIFCGGAYIIYNLTKTGTVNIFQRFNGQ